MLSQLSTFSLDQFGDAAAMGILAATALVLLLLCVLVAATWRFRRLYIRRSESIDKRLSEVLWRTRHSDAEELRKRTAVLEEQLVDMLQYLRTVANTIDSQMEAMTNEMKHSLGKSDRADSKSVGQSRMVMYQLERIRKQLEVLEEARPASRRTSGSPSGAVEGAAAKRPIGRADSAYRVEAVMEPIRQRVREVERSHAEVEGMLDELSWEQR